MMLTHPQTTTSTSSALPTRLQQSPLQIASQRRAIIAGSASGFVILVLLLLGGVFWYKRRKNRKFEFLDALAEPVQREHSRAMLLAGEDMDMADPFAGPGVGGGGGGSGIVSGGGGGGAGRGSASGGRGSGSQRESIFLSNIHHTPWDTGTSDPRSSMEALHHPSRYTPPQPSEATQYMTQYLMRARGSETGSIFHEGGVWPPPGEGATLVDPILRSSSEVDLTGIVDSVMGPSREGSPTRGGNNVSGPAHTHTPGHTHGGSGSGSGGGGGGGYGAPNHTRTLSTASQSPLLLPLLPTAGPSSSAAWKPPSPTIGWNAAPARSSPLKGAVHADGGSGESGEGGAGGEGKERRKGGSEEEDKMTRTKNWIERSLAK
jgi:hypothetical protein